MKLEEERRALAAFVTRFDALGLGASASTSIIPPRLRQHALPSVSLGPTAFSARRRRSSYGGFTLSAVPELSPAATPDGSPVKLELATLAREAPNLLLESTPGVPDDDLAEIAEVEGLVDVSFSEAGSPVKEKTISIGASGLEKFSLNRVPSRGVLQDKENIVPL